MAPIGAIATPLTYRQRQEEREQFNRDFDAVFFPSDREMAKAVLGAVGILASIILLPLLCSLGAR